MRVPEGAPFLFLTLPDRLILLFLLLIFLKDGGNRYLDFAQRHIHFRPQIFSGRRTQLRKRNVLNRVTGRRSQIRERNIANVAGVIRRRGGSPVAIDELIGGDVGMDGRRSEKEGEGRKSRRKASDKNHEF